MEDGGQLPYLHADGMGSVVKGTNSAGAVTLVRQYDAWGNLASGGDQPGYAFTGREWDPEVKLYYYRARYYEPGVGRFFSEDPVGLAEGVNLYVYVRNDPVQFSDPTGLTVWVCNRKAKTTPGGNHAYYWDDRNRTCCGMNSVFGLGSPTKCSEPGPPTDECRPVEGSDGREPEIFRCCEATANAPLIVSMPYPAPIPWFPGINDCHTAVDRCLKQSGLTNPGPPGGRVGPPCDPCRGVSGQSH